MTTATSTATAHADLQTLINITPALRTALRRAAGLSARNTRPVEVVDGAAAPREAGQSWHYRTRTGTYIQHPSAYSRHGWSSMVYHSSTRRVEVGASWLIAALAAGPARELRIAA